MYTLFGHKGPRVRAALAMIRTTCRCGAVNFDPVQLGDVRTRRLDDAVTEQYLD